MYHQPKYILLSLIGVLIQSSLSISSFSNEVFDVSRLESTQKQAMSPTDFRTSLEKALLKQDHLNSWRDLRTIEEVAMNRKDTYIFKEKVADFVKDLARKHPPLNDQDWLSPSALGLWNLSRANKSLCTLLYYMKQTLKLHLTQDTHQEIDNMAEEIIANFQFKSWQKDHPVRERIGPFLDTVMSEMGFYLLMKNLNMGTDTTLKMDAHLLVDKVNHWKGVTGKKDQLHYSKTYRAYMNLIEVFDILAAAGLHDRGVISKLTPSSMKSHIARKILTQYAPKARDMHYYLINDVPYNPPKKLTLPIFGYPFELHGQDSTQVQDQVHKLWSKFQEEDLNVALQLEQPMKTNLKIEEKFPEHFRRMQQFISLWEMKDKSEYKNMWRSISRSIGLALELETTNSDAHVIFWEILYAIFKYQPKGDIDPQKAEVQIKNGVMFYLFIRRMGRVLEEIFKMHASISTPHKEVKKEQCMMYYWTLFSYLPSRGSYNWKDKIKWVEFEIGRVYLDHLLSSIMLNELFLKKSTTQDNIISDELSSSSLSENLGQSSILDPPRTFKTIGKVNLIDSETPIKNLKFVKARGLERKTKLEDLKKASVLNQATHKPPNVFFKTNRVLMSNNFLEPKFFASIPKKPRTQPIEYNSQVCDNIDILHSKIDDTGASKKGRTQRTIHNEGNLEQQIVNQNPSYQSNGDFEALAASLKAHHFPKSPLDQRITSFTSHVNLRNVHPTESPSVEDRDSFMLPDLNETVEPDYM